MKFVHLSDLHIGKKVNGYSMLEDQEYILNQITTMIAKEQPDAVVIAGDVYDKPVPPVEAVQMLDKFLCTLAGMNLEVFLISGNHDSQERLGFAASLIESKGIHIVSEYLPGQKMSFSMEDEHGEVVFHLLPFIKPVQMKRFYPEAEIESYSDAVEVAINHIKDFDPKKRNVLITHQFVTGALRTESEDICVGGSDNVSAELFKDFDYTALGHIHKPQKMSLGNIRYCGTPLKYSFSEAKDKKSMTIVEMKEKGDVEVTELSLIPMKDMCEVKGSFELLTTPGFYTDPKQKAMKESYLHITLTDEEDILDAFARLKMIYPYLMKMDYESSSKGRSGTAGTAGTCEGGTPMGIFQEFFVKQNEKPLTEKQESLLKGIIESVWDIKQEDVVEQEENE